MYTSHFGLNEPPFSLGPDPRYLYMSERHREGLAHLLFGIGEGGGFVQLTGEVGTGKTTLCRALLEQLPPQVDVALILNPRLTGPELLATACDELRIPYPRAKTSTKASTRVLVNALYQYLLDAHGRGRRTVLIIDEAQSLAGEVLEEVRLLTNLETAKTKLLQIILIGQPELTELLEGKKLRQLAQRITARYHLTPFSRRETRAYIRHRLQVAGQPRPIFSDAAVRVVHRRSGGVPRLINVICDRALLGAYAHGRRRVGAATARRAAAEVFGRRTRWRFARVTRWALAVAVVAAAGLWVALAPGSWVRLRGTPAAAPGQRVAMLVAEDRRPAPPAAVMVRAEQTPQTSDGAHEARAAPAKGAPEPGPRTVTLAEVLGDSSIPSDKESAFASLYAHWGVDYRAGRDGLACERGQSRGLQCLFRVGNWNRLRRFNLPAILGLMASGGERRYATVTTVGEQQATLRFGRHAFTWPLGEIDRFWDGSFVLLWKPPALSKIPLAPGARGKDVEWLRRRLGEIDGAPAREGLPDIFDDALRARVVAFQRSRSLVADGIVGEETLAQLSAGKDERIGRLVPERAL